MARLSSGAAIAVQFFPDAEHLHEGMQLAAIVLLVGDVLIDLLGGLCALVRQAWKSVRNARTSWRRDADGSVVVGFKIRLSSAAPRAVARVTGRVTSAVLILFSGESVEWHMGLLSAAFVIVLLDVLGEGARTVGELVRKRLG